MRSSCGGRKVQTALYVFWQMIPRTKAFKGTTLRAGTHTLKIFGASHVHGAIYILSTLHWNRRSLFDDRPRLEKFDKPVLLLTGDEDYYLVGETNAFLNEVLPHATWRRFEGVQPPMTGPRFERFSRSFLARVGACRGPGVGGRDCTV